MVRRLSLRFATLLAGTAAAAAVEAAAVPRRPRSPDLSGGWTSTSLTSLERPRELPSLEVDDATAAAWEARRPGQIRSQEIDGVGGRQSEVDGWDIAPHLARIGGRARTSWIVDPPDGRLPYSKAGLAFGDALEAQVNTDGPESRPTPERCLMPGWGNGGPPMLNAPYSNTYLVVQTPGEVAIVTENDHEVRHLRLGAAHAPGAVRPWMGDTVARWEGATLVAETTNLNPGESLRPPTRLVLSKDARIVERFTRLDGDHLLYAFEVDDPAVYTRRWRGEMVWTRTDARVFEYACHEGNYAIANVLRGARREEAVAAAAPAR